MVAQTQKHIIMPTIDEIKELLAQAESAMSELRDESDSPSYSEAHRHISEALTALGR